MLVCPPSLSPYSFSGIFIISAEQTFLLLAQEFDWLSLLPEYAADALIRLAALHIQQRAS
jgi:hypothetical protein